VALSHNKQYYSHRSDEGHGYTVSATRHRTIRTKYWSTDCTLATDGRPGVYSLQIRLSILYTAQLTYRSRIWWTPVVTYGNIWAVSTRRPTKVLNLGLRWAQGPPRH